MKAIEIAKQLGEAIKNDEVLLAYDKAKADYESNKELQDKLASYNAQRAALAEEFNKEIEEQSSEVIGKIKENMDALGKEIVEHSEYKAFADAQRAVNDFMAEINQEIARHAFGIEPQNCTHDCSTCSGCH